MEGLVRIDFDSPLGGTFGNIIKMDFKV